MPYESEIAEIAAATERLRPDKVGVRQISVVYNVRLTAHRAELQKPAFAEDLLIDALVALKTELVFRIVFVPGVTPTVSGAFFESERDDLFHKGQKEALFRKLLHPGRIEKFPHFLRYDPERFFFAFAVFLRHLVHGDQRQYLRHMLLIAFVAVFLFLKDQNVHSGAYFSFVICRKSRKIVLIAAYLDKSLGSVFFS